jgi:hypothetical protein
VWRDSLTCFRMNVMFSKWKHKQTTTTTNSEACIGGLEKDGDGGDSHPRSYRTHLIFAGKRDPEGTVGQSVVTQPGSHYYGGHSTSMSFSSHSNHPFAQPQSHLRQGQVSGPPNQAHFQLSAQPDTSRRKPSRNAMLLDEDCYRPGNKQVRKNGFYLTY